MKTFHAWITPVATSLLIHAALVALLAYRMSQHHTDTSQQQSLTVTLLGQQTDISSKIKPASKKSPAPVPIKDEQPALTQALQTTATATPQTVASSAETGSTATPSPMAVHSISKLTRPPAFMRKIEPVYPAAEQRAGSQANVLAEVTIDDKGNVLKVKIVKSAGRQFDDAVIEALQKSLFVPGYIDQQAVAVRVLVPFRFNLK